MKMGCNLALSQEVVSQFTSFENLSCVEHIFDGFFFFIVLLQNINWNPVKSFGGVRGGF